jgi:hypothetical protein
MLYNKKGSSLLNFLPLTSYVRLNFYLLNHYFSAYNALFCSHRNNVDT